MFDRLVIVTAKEHARSAFPKESCGLIVKDRYIPCSNSSDEPPDRFKISMEEFVRVSKEHGPVLAVVHSHVNGPDYPSKLDMESQMAMNVPWGIIVVKPGYVAEPFWFGDGVPVPPLLERPFRWGVTDCYALVRDWYRLSFDMHLPNFPREDEWWLNGGNMFEDCYEEAGFVRLDGKRLPEKPGDVVVGKIYSKVPNHCGVYEGDGLMLHHLGNRLSERVPVEPWAKFIHVVFRHRDFL